MATDSYNPADELMTIVSEVPAPKVVAEPMGAQRLIVATPHGDVTVHVEGNRENPRMRVITYHEVGLDYFSCFEGLLKHPDANPLLKHATIYHITAPGQGTTDPNFVGTYPTMEELSEQIDSVVAHCEISTFYGIGAGAGANIMLRYAARLNRGKCQGLMLISPLLKPVGWFEWSFQKAVETQMAFQTGVPSFVVSQLISGYFCSATQADNHDLIKVYENHLSKNLNVNNFRHFLASYIARDDMTERITPQNFKVPTIIVYGGNSIHEDIVEEGFPCFAPGNTTNLRIWAAGDMVHEEHPAELLRAFTLFLNGRGIFLGGD